MDLNSEIERLTRERDEARAAWEGCQTREGRPVRTPEEMREWVHDVVQAGIDCSAGLCLSGQERRAAEQDAARLAAALKEALMTAEWALEERDREPRISIDAALAAHEARVGGGR